MSLSNMRNTYLILKQRVQNRLMDELQAHPEWTVGQYEEIQQALREPFNNILRKENIVLGQQEQEVFFKQIVADIVD